MFKSQIRELHFYLPTPSVGIHHMQNIISVAQLWGFSVQPKNSLVKTGFGQSTSPTLNFYTIIFSHHHWVSNPPGKLQKCTCLLCQLLCKPNSLCWYVETVENQTLKDKITPITHVCDSILLHLTLLKLCP